MFSPEKQRIWFVKNVPFGAFVDDEMILNKNGEIVESVRNDLPNHYAHVELDCHIIMPNHIYGIIIIVGAGPCACPNVGQPQGVCPYRVVVAGCGSPV